MQKRLVRKLDLELLISKVKVHPSPNPNLEQYTISADVAATVLYLAANSNGDIIDRSVLDLGCGTGRLAIGAAFLGARKIIGIDIDRSAVIAAAANANILVENAKIEWIVGDIAAVQGSFETVLQNPPYGIQKRGADRHFLRKALDCGRIVYSLHKSVDIDRVGIRKMKPGEIYAMRHGSSFLEKFISENGGRILAVYSLLMTLPHMFDFHKKFRHDFIVDLYVIQGRIKSS